MRTQYIIGIVYAFSALFLLENIFGSTLETSLAMDGAYRGYAHASFRSSRMSAGFSIRTAADRAVTGAFGLNYGILSIGSLNDSGLASEIRRPFFPSLGRIGESIYYRANLRALSFSRAGIALTGWNGRLGVVFEKRKTLTAAVLWAVPLLGEQLTAEILAKYGTLKGLSFSEGWYPKKTGYPFGVMGTGAIRIRYHPRYWNIGISAMSSGGTSFRPGWALAPALIYSEKIWRVRFRAFGASPFFRDTEGRRPPSPFGFGTDVRRSPKQGFLFSVFYKGQSGWKDSARILFGWRFSQISVRMESHWDRVVPLKRIQLGFTWEHRNWTMDLKGTYRPDNRWNFFYGISLSVSNRWKLDGGLTLRRELYDWAGDFYLNVAALLGRNRLSLKIQTRNLFKGWADSSPSASRFYIQLKWHMNINKKLTPPTQTGNLFAHNES